MMLDIFTTISDIIAPPPESVRLIRKYEPNEMIQFLSPTRVGSSCALSNFHNPVIHATIIANKFHDHPKAAVLAAALLEHWLTTLPSRPTWLIPIPLGPKRYRERGYNQVERITRSVTRVDTNHLPLLKRNRDTSPQTDLTRDERLKNITDAFSVSTKNLPTYGRVIIVDDVITTGATLHSAYLTLTPHLSKECELLTVAIAH